MSAPHPGAPVLVLVGMPGSGKTSVGRALAAALGVPFRDSDELVEAATGRSVRELFARSEQVFREHEAAAVTAALLDFPGVLALGGGALLSPAVRAAVQECVAPVVLLRAGLDTLTDRVGDDGTRPLLAGDAPGRLRALAADRAALYAEAADVAIDTDGHDVATVVELVRAATVSAA